MPPMGGMPPPPMGGMMPPMGGMPAPMGGMMPPMGGMMPPMGGMPWGMVAPPFVNDFNGLMADIHSYIREGGLPYGRDAVNKAMELAHKHIVQPRQSEPAGWPEALDKVQELIKSQPAPAPVNITIQDVGKVVDSGNSHNGNKTTHHSEDMAEAENPNAMTEKVRKMIGEAADDGESGGGLVKTIDEAMASRFQNATLDKNDAGNITEPPDQSKDDEDFPPPPPPPPDPEEKVSSGAMFGGSGGGSNPNHLKLVGLAKQKSKIEPKYTLPADYGEAVEPIEIKDPRNRSFYVRMMSHLTEAGGLITGRNKLGQISASDKKQCVRFGKDFFDGHAEKFIKYSMAKVLKEKPGLLVQGNGRRTNSTTFFQELCLEMTRSYEKGGFPNNYEVIRNMLHWVACWARTSNTNSGAESEECKKWFSELINNWKLPPEPAGSQITILNPDEFAERMGIE